MKRDIDLSRWHDKAREKLLARRQYRCPCGSVNHDKLSYNRRTDVICQVCGVVIWRMTEVQPTYIQVVG